MGGKKKKKAASKEVDEDDESTPKLRGLYRKKCQEFQIPQSSKMMEKFSIFDEEGTPLREVHFHEHLGWAGARAIADAFREINYPHPRSLRFWQCEIGDEGIRAVSQYLNINKSLTILEVLDNQISPLGCEFLGRSLHPSKESNLTIVRLDHNHIGALGVRHLANGLCMNTTLVQLSLNYCGLEAEAADPLIEIVIFTESALTILSLQGNFLKKDGIVRLCDGLPIAKKLEKIILADNQFGEEDEVLEALSKVIIKNKTLKDYNLQYNAIREKGAQVLCKAIRQGAVVKMDLNERIQKEILTDIKDACAENKGIKKGKKGKKGKKKKKKK